MGAYTLSVHLFVTSLITVTGALITIASFFAPMLVL
jgi:hypothetical protein